MTDSAPDGIVVRAARPADRVDVSRVLDGAMLAVADLPERIAADEVLVAVDDVTVCGALVLATAGPEAPDVEPPARWRAYPHVRAIAVRRRRRDRGIGTALVRAAVERFGTLVADLEDGVQPFYESLDAELVPASEHRWWALVSESEHSAPD